MIWDILIPLLILGILGIVFGLLLGYASKKFAVPQDPLFPKLRDALPGANCGACGYAGCDAYAKAVAAGEAPVGKCPVGGASAAEAMGEIMGVTAETEDRMVAYIRCSGNQEVAGDRYRYHGVQSCNEAAMIPGGGAKLCAYGCLGLGSCAAACSFDAIHIVNGIAKVDEKSCKACGSCIKACPKHLISLIPAVLSVRPSCSNPERGKDVKEVCQVGCIGCGLCMRACEAGAIKMENGLPQIDASLCTGCHACAEKCPVKIIHLAE